MKVIRNKMSDKRIALLMITKKYLETVFSLFKEIRELKKEMKNTRKSIRIYDNGMREIRRGTFNAKDW